MGTGDTRILRSPTRGSKRAADSEPNRGASRSERRAARDLSIVDPAGHQRYLGRPPYFGPLDPDSLEGFLLARDYCHH
jgi:hypothetical protein